MSLSYLPSEQKDADETKAYIQQKAPSCKVQLFPGDLKSEKTCQEAIASCVQEFGTIDILVNNAAQQLENNDVTTLKSDQWLDTFQVNMYAYRW